MENSAMPLWAIVTIAGPAVLGLALLYGRIQNRRRRRALEARRGNRA
jgi:hypothetical protein